MGLPYFRISEIGDLVGAIEADKRDFSEAVWKALKARGDALKQELRDDIANSGMKNAKRVANTWRGDIYPKSSKSYARRPAYYVGNRSPYFTGIFQTGGIVRGQDTLLVPIGVARQIKLPRGPGGRFQGHDALLAEVKKRYGPKLTTRKMGDGTTVLGVYIAAAGRKSRFLPLFLLVKSVTLRARLHSDAIFAKWQRRFDAEFGGDVVKMFDAARALRMR